METTEVQATAKDIWKCGLEHPSQGGATRASLGCSPQRDAAVQQHKHAVRGMMSGTVLGKGLEVATLKHIYVRCTIELISNIGLERKAICKLTNPIRSLVWGSGIRRAILSKGPEMRRRKLGHSPNQR